MRYPTHTERWSSRSDRWSNIVRYFYQITGALGQAEAESYITGDPVLQDLIAEAIIEAEQWVKVGDREDKRGDLQSYLKGGGADRISRLADILHDAVQRANRIKASRIQGHLSKAQRFLTSRNANLLRAASMASLKDQLIRLGSAKPELQKHLRPILDRVSNGFDPMDFMDQSEAGGSDLYWEGAVESAKKTLMDNLQKAMRDQHGKLWQKVERGNSVTWRMDTTRSMDRDIARAVRNKEAPSDMPVAVILDGVVGPMGREWEAAFIETAGGRDIPVRLSGDDRDFTPKAIAKVLKAVQSL